MMVHRERVLQAVIDKFAVGLVADEQDVRPKFIFLFAEYLADFAKSFFAVHRTWWIVRRINQNGPCLFTDGLLQLVHPGFKSFIRGQNTGYAVVVSDVVDILGEERGKDDDLISLVQYRFQDDVQSSSRPVGHDDVIQGEFDAGL